MRKNIFSAAVCIACAALFCLPAASHAKRGMPDYVIEKSYGDNNTGPALLIAFATNYGSTYRVAEVIAEVMSAEGYRVDLHFAKNIASGELDGYDAVILGSSIYIEKWHADALAFLDLHQDALADIPIAYYCVNGLLGMNFEGKEDLVEEHYVQPMYALYSSKFVPKDIAAFAGAVDYRILNFKDWMMLHLMFMPRGNWTDYAAVVSWAYEVSGKLQ
jgi:menaquinone-dependent protoporphyrinogen oxidase